MLEFLRFRKRPYQDEDAKKRKKKIENGMDQIIEFGTEEDALEIARAWHKRPLTPQETEDIVTSFRAAKREHGR
jgi:hypothetical protein